MVKNKCHMVGLHCVIVKRSGIRLPVIFIRRNFTELD